MFFDILSTLCKTKGVSTYKACTDIGLNRAAVGKWKKGTVPNGTTLAKLADYFGVTTDYLLGTDLQSQIDVTAYKISELEKELEHADDCDRIETENSIEILKESYSDLCLAQSLIPLNKKAPTQESERQISDDDIKFALFGGDGEITDAMYDEVKRFAKMVKLREEAEKKKE